MSADKTSRGNNTAKKNTVAKNLRKSIGIGPRQSLQRGSANYELANIEAEYITNLQQQIYFLELEANYLREKSKNAQEMQPRMTAEVERLIHKLKLMQSEVDATNVELQRRESSISIIHNEKLKLLEKLRMEEDGRRKDKEMLTDEIVILKKDKVIMERDLQRNVDTICELRAENERQLLATKNAEMLVSSLKSQLEHRVEQHKMTQISLDERRADLVTCQAQLKATEEKYYNSGADNTAAITQDLRDEVMTAHQRMKEMELAVEQERSLKAKVMANLDAVIKENAALHQKSVEMQSQLGREEKMRDMNVERRARSLTEFASLQDTCKQLTFDLHHSEDMLQREKARNLELLDQLSSANNQDIKLNTSRSRVAELENLCDNVKRENEELVKDKLLLVDHVSDIQKKLTSRDEEMAAMRLELKEAREKLNLVEGRTNLELSMQNEKWQEFGRLAESMQQLSASMVTRRSKTTE